MALEIIGLIIVVVHLMVVGSFILWFGLGKPTTWQKFRSQFMRQFFGVGS